MIGPTRKPAAGATTSLLLSKGCINHNKNLMIRFIVTITIAVIFVTTLVNIVIITITVIITHRNNQHHDHIFKACQKRGSAALAHPKPNGSSECLSPFPRALGDVKGAPSLLTHEAIPFPHFI